MTIAFAIFAVATLFIIAVALYADGLWRTK